MDQAIFRGNSTYFVDYFKDRNFVIPSYQRPLSWKKEDVEQLFSDVDTGLSKLDNNHPIQDERIQKARFIGCIIEWSREASETTDYRQATGQSFINSVVEIIDGQQRTSVLLIAFTQLYFRFLEMIETLDTQNTHEALLKTYIADQVLPNWIFPAFSRPGISTSTYAYRPSIIRHPVDKWKNVDPHEFKSPLAKYFYDSLRAIEDYDDTSNLSPPTSDDENLTDLITAINECLDSWCSKESNIFETAYTRETIFSLGAQRFRSPDWHQIAKSDIGLGRCNPLLNLIGHTYFMQHFCVFTVITSPNEETALDIFQSLNATGQQLTALELLKPDVYRVHKNNGLNFDLTEERKQLDEINAWLNSGNNSRNRTTQFFLKFGLSFSGTNIQSGLGSQRRWLKDSFEAYSTSLAKANEFVNRMYYCQQYLKEFSLEPRNTLFKEVNGSYPNLQLSHPTLKKTHPLTPAAQLAFMFLIDQRHDIAHTVLSSAFVEYCLTSDDPMALQKSKDFCRLCLACASTFLLWRASFGSGYPDGAYKDIMSNTCFLKAGPINAKQIIKNLRLKISEELKKQDTKISVYSWADKIAQNLWYKQGYQHIIRFALIVASHKTVAKPLKSKAKYGLIEVDNSGTDYLGPKIWLDSRYQQIEHIAPKSLINGTSWLHWNTTLSGDTLVIHSLGNLTLLGNNTNPSVSESSIEKRDYYHKLVSPGTQSNATPTAKALQSQSPNLAHLFPVYLRLTKWEEDIARGINPADSEFDWNEGFIKSRSNNIARIVLKRMLLWLKST